MKQAEDIFDARLKRIHGNPKAERAPKKSSTLKAKLAKPVRRPEQHSVLLPVFATAFLVLGASAFGTVLFLPELPQGEFYASDGSSSFAVETVVE